MPIRRLIAALGYTLLGWVTSASGQAVATFDGLSDRVNTVTFSPDGKTLVGASGRFIGLLQEPRPGKALLCDVSTRKVRDELTGHRDGVSCATFSPDGKVLATGSYDGSMRLWDPATARSLGTVEGNHGPIVCATFSPSGRFLAVGCFGGNQGASHEFALWSVPDRKLIATAPAHEDWFNAILFLCDNQSLVTGSMDGTVKVWDAAESQLQRTLKWDIGSVHTLARSPDGKILVAGGGELAQQGAGGLRLWRTDDWHELASIAMPNVVWSTAFSPDGKFLAVLVNDEIRLLDASTRLERPAFRERPASGRSVCFSPDGKLLASGSGEGTIRAWAFPRVEQPQK